MSDRPADLDGPPPPDADFFGSDTPLEQARFHLIPVPWEATVSYRLGAADGPEASSSGARRGNVISNSASNASRHPWAVGRFSL